KGRVRGIPRPALSGLLYVRVAVLLRRGRDDVDDAATAPGAELHRALGEREQRVVAATADQVARVEVRTPLADDDLAGVDQLTAVPLHAEALRVGVATVTGR